MPNSQNGWPVIDAEKTKRWTIPGTDRGLTLRKGPAGFILAVTALWFHEKVERLDLGEWDEWGWAVRDIRGSTTISNHASGTAMDLNATQHPLGVPTNQTFTRKQRRAIRRRLRWMRVVRWGGDYEGRPDAMHFEIIAGRRAVRAFAAVLRVTPRGIRVRRANRR